MFGDYHNPNDYWQHNGYDPYKDMNPDERMAAGCLQGAAFFLMLVVGILLCALFGSCKSVEYVPVERVRTDTVRVNRTVHDSIWVQDSIHIHEKGDTVWIERWHTRWENHLVHDTVYKSRTDSVPVPYSVTREVERKRTTVEWGLLATGVLALLGGAAWLVGMVRRMLP